jgi:hypothetical protein
MREPSPGPHGRVAASCAAVEAELVEARAEAAGVRCQLEQARPKPPRTRWGRSLAWRKTAGVITGLISPKR